jgi:hypothetical protein
MGVVCCTLGRSHSLRGRLYMLRRMFYQARQRGHIAAMTYRASPRLKTIAPPTHLAFRFKHHAECTAQECAVVICAIVCSWHLADMTRTCQYVR